MKLTLIVLFSLMSCGLYAQSFSMGYNFGFASFVTKSQTNKIAYVSEKIMPTPAYSIYFTLYSEKKKGLALGLFFCKRTLPNVFKVNNEYQHFNSGSIQLAPGMVFNLKKSLHVFSGVYASIYSGGSATKHPNPSRFYNGKYYTENFKDFGLYGSVSYEPFQKFFEQKVDLLYSLAIQAKAQIAIANNNEANYLPYSLSVGAALVFR